jgi:CheY-like chemotaxis protein
MLVPRVHPIMLLEDEADDASFVRRALQKANIKNPLLVCNNAAKARARLKRMAENERPALVIVDIFLPGRESGIDFLTWLREQPPPLGAVPAMIYTVSTQSEHTAAAEALGSVVFLRKPMTEAALADAAQALGFVITTTREGGRSERVITPRHTSLRTGR